MSDTVRYFGPRHPETTRYADDVFFGATSWLKDIIPNLGEGYQITRGPAGCSEIIVTPPPLQSGIRASTHPAGPFCRANGGEEKSVLLHAEAIQYTNTESQRSVARLAVSIGSVISDSPDNRTLSSTVTFIEQGLTSPGGQTAGMGLEMRLARTIETLPDLGMAVEDFAHVCLGRIGVEEGYQKFFGAPQAMAGFIAFKYA